MILTPSIDCIVSESVDEFAPISQRRIKKKQPSDCVSNKEVDDAKGLRRQLE